MMANVRKLRVRKPQVYSTFILSLFKIKLHKYIIHVFTDMSHKSKSYYLIFSACTVKTI
jgi:hypothetical protein